MKQKLSKLEAVVTALAASVTETNKTEGMKIKCYFYDSTSTVDSKVREYQRQQLDALNRKDYETFNKLRKDIAAIPAVKNLIFKLVEPIETVIGTKKVKDGNGFKNPIAKNVTEIIINENNVDLLSFTETRKTEKNKYGQEVPVIILDIEQCMLEVTEPRVVDRKVVAKSKVYVSPLSFATMQLIGRAVYQEENALVAREYYV